MADLALYLDGSLPYAVMLLVSLFLAFFLTILQSVLTDDGVSSVVFVVYQQLIASTLLSAIALIFERGKRPALSFNVLSWAFFIGFLQIPVSEVMQTTSLRYVTSTFLSVGINVTPALVFVLAVLTGREEFSFRSLIGQAKLLGVVASVAGATVLVVCSDPGVPDPDLAHRGAMAAVGCVLVGFTVLVGAVSMILVERLALKYPADLTLSATMSVFGTLQTVILAVFLDRNPSSWKISWSNKLQLLSIFLGGTFTTGLVFVARNWCVHKKGPVFTAGFTPLLVVFSFLLQVLVLRDSAQLSSIFGAILVIAGLYLLLWAKSKEYESRSIKGVLRSSSERFNEEPLLTDTI